MKGKSFKKSMLLVLLSALCVIAFVMAGCAPRRVVNSITLSETELEFTIGEDMDEDDLTAQLTATILPSESLQKVTWESSDDTVVSVTQDGIVTAKKPGEAEIYATAEADKTFTPAVCYVTVNGTPVTGVTASETEITIAVGEEKTVSATVQPADASNKKLNFAPAPNAKSLFQVDETGKVKGLKVGKGKLFIRSAEDASIKAEVSVTVTAAAVAVTEVTLDASTLEVGIGAEKTLVATVAPADATNKNVTWVSNNTNVATVDAQGKVKGIAVGTAIVMAKTEDGGFTATCEVTVSADAAVAVTGVNLMPAKVTLAAGATKTLTAVVTPSTATNKAVTWSTSNAAVATVDADGNILAVGAGEAEITVTTVDGNKTATCTVTVTGEAAAKSVALNKNALSLTVGGAGEQLTATTTPAGADVVWESSNTDIATVDAQGNVVAVAAGEAKITVKLADDATVTAECTVTVTAGGSEAVTSVTLNKDTLTLAKEASEQLTATTTPAGAAVVWESSDTDVATVSETGVVTAVGVGTATITAKLADDATVTAECTVTVTIPVAGISMDTESFTLEVGDEELVGVTITPSNASNKNVTYESSDEEVVTVDADGNILAVGAGEATITVTTEDGNKTATCTVTVNAAPVAVTGVKLDKEAATVAPGGTITLFATVQPENADNKNIIWESSDENVATVANGVVTGVTASSSFVTIMAKTEDGNYVATCRVTVGVAVTSVTLDKTSASIGLNGTLQLNATVEPDNATSTTVQWTSSDSTVASVTNGLVTARKIGTAIITAKSVSDSTKIAQCTIEVVAVSVASITLSSTDNTVLLEAAGQATGKLQLTATVKPDNASNKTLTWTSSDESIATVSQEGLVTYVSGNREGRSVTITATAADGSGVSAARILICKTNGEKPRTIKGMAVMTSGSSDVYNVENGAILVFTKVDSTSTKKETSVLNGTYTVGLTDGTWTVSVKNDTLYKCSAQIAVDGSGLSDKAIEFKYDLFTKNLALGGTTATQGAIKAAGDVNSENFVFTATFKGNEAAITNVEDGFGIGVLGGTWTAYDDKKVLVEEEPYMQIGTLGYGEAVSANKVRARLTDGGYTTNEFAWKGAESDPDVFLSDINAGIELKMVVYNNELAFFVRKVGGTWFECCDYTQTLSGTVTGMYVRAFSDVAGKVSLVDYSYTPIMTATSGADISTTIKAKGGSSTEWNVAQGTRMYVANGEGYVPVTLGANGTLSMKLEDGTYQVTNPNYSGAATITVSGGEVTANVSTLNYRLIRSTLATDTMFDANATSKTGWPALHLPHFDKFVFEMTVKANSDAKTLGETSGGLGWKLSELDHVYKSTTYQNLSWQCGLNEVDIQSNPQKAGNFMARWCDDWSGAYNLTSKDGTAFDLALYKNEGLTVRLVCDNDSYSIYAYIDGSWQKQGNTLKASDGVKHGNGKTVASIVFNHWPTEKGTTTSQPSKVHISDMKVIFGTSDGTVKF